MRVEFMERANGPERLVCEAEVVFEKEAGPLAGMRLLGFSLWRSADGEVFVTLPARRYDAGGERRFFDLLRPVDDQPGNARRAKAWILEQYRASSAAAA